LRTSDLDHDQSDLQKRYTQGARTTQEEEICIGSGPAPTPYQVDDVISPLEFKMMENNERSYMN
jgi:hypothetical protein